MTAPGDVVGLSEDLAQQRLAADGPNLLVPAPARSRARDVARVVADPMTLLLLFAVPVYFALGDIQNAVVVLVALVPITAVSIALERRAERALDALASMNEPMARVVRDGLLQVVPIETVVVGDVLVVDEGDVIGADGRIIDTRQLSVDESALTGESHPVVKDVAGTGDAAQLFAGTTVLSGHAVAEVTVTGPRTRYGAIAALVAGVRPPTTPLQLVVRRLVVQLGALAMLISLGVGGLELIRGNGWNTAVVAGLSLAIATVPEELPLIFTLYLALGARRLAREHALVRRLASVETLGSTGVICTDKTGTLTVGRIEVAMVVTEDGATYDADAQPLSGSARTLLEIAVLASEPERTDPLDQAIVRFAQHHHLDVAVLHAGELARDYEFDATDRYLSHVWRHDGRYRVVAKGALEGLLRHGATDSPTKERLVATQRRLAELGLRVIGVAAGELAAPSNHRRTDEAALRVLGLIAFADPVRDGVPEALAACTQAGVRVVMMTGDHPVTAHAVAETLGLEHDDARICTGEELDRAGPADLAEFARTTNIFARIRPEQKHRLVESLRAQGNVVAMTGDGINDAPALRQADIGIAMGQRGTEVARESSSMILLDDNFATIVTAVREGRRIFSNLGRAVAYLIAFHVPLVLGALVVPMLDRPLLFLPVHLLLLQIVVHPTVSFVFERDELRPAEMRAGPRPPRAGLVDRRTAVRVFAMGLAMSLGVLAVYLGQLDGGASANAARGCALATLLLGELGCLFVTRAGDLPLWRARVLRNRALVVATAAMVVLTISVFVVPPLRELMHVAPLTAEDWLLAVGVAAATTLWTEPFKTRRATAARHHAPL